MSLSKEERNDLKREILKEIRKELNAPKKVYVEVCRDGVELPEYANKGDAGMDIRAAESTQILPGETKIIPTGLKMAIPEGYEIQVRPRSGLSVSTPLRIANTPGTIDSGYRDEIGIIIHNSSTDKTTNNSQNITFSIKEKGNKKGIYKINKGDRIAQIVLVKVEEAELEIVEEGLIKTLGRNRGGGFGHTGTN